MDRAEPLLTKVTNSIDRDAPSGWFSSSQRVQTDDSNTQLLVVVVKDSQFKIQATVKYSRKGSFMNSSLCFWLQMTKLGQSAQVK